MCHESGIPMYEGVENKKTLESPIYPGSDSDDEMEKRVRKLRTPIMLLISSIAFLIDRMLGFCIFIMYFEKCELAIFGIPGLELTTSATYFLGYKFGFPIGVVLAFFLPGFLIQPLKFFLWRERTDPEEGPIPLGIGSFLDGMVGAIGWMTSRLGMNIFFGMGLALFLKHGINVIKSLSSDRPQTFDAAVSTVTNFVTLFFIYKFLLNFLL